MMKTNQSRPVMIAGTRFDSMAQAYRVAQGKGYTGSRSAFVKMIRRNAGNIIHLGDLADLSPCTREVTPNVTAFYRRRAGRNTRMREEMTRMCAELDARKAALKEAA
ncbi:hypothetical protein [Dyella caseinilytica]|uniref:Uncharacterized protein n=1 Tax=Dyella caseinilytica TaxID=1849581 RepID=A0ABX7GT15_9GAMM|nr:hypothetical protein [Dyella caseinilytica]QRN52415.1 hypothetical protein ISN74_13110 [Dyella caseinilytica]GGA05781.1 hypothetical protein GCM10011408_28410 [Dyella caseinilytica]